MQCRELREMADSYLSEELLVETNHEVLRHLEGCPVCREEMAARRELRVRLKRAFCNAESLQPDAALTERLSARLRGRTAGTRARRSSGAPRWWAIAAGLVLASVLGRVAWLRVPDNQARPSDRSVAAAAKDERLSHDAAGDHRDCALHFRLAEAPIPLEEGARLYDAAYRSLDEAVRSARDAQGRPFEFVEAHVCVFEKRRFAHIVLRSGGRLVSVLVTADDSQDGSTRGAAAVRALASVDGFRAASFAAPRHQVFVVSELAAAENLAIARAVAGPVSHHLAGV